jgi:hypothetical protein
MSYNTVFEDNRQEAKEALGVAIKKLSVCVDEDTHGYSDMQESFIDDLIQMIAQLTKMKRKL